jgi:hypothetical protein
VVGSSSFLFVGSLILRMAYNWLYTSLIPCLVIQWLSMKVHTALLRKTQFLQYPSLRLLNKSPLCHLQSNHHLQLVLPYISGHIWHDDLNILVILASFEVEDFLQWLPGCFLINLQSLLFWFDISWVMGDLPVCWWIHVTMWLNQKIVMEIVGSEAGNQ